jgi:propionyl-CoA carboxylase alpha chain
MIHTLLVANRGEIASRVFRTCRVMGIRTVAVYADPDAALPYVREADCAVALRGSTAAESYLVIEKLLDAARASGADAIHPGFGFLSENATFAQAVIDAGLTWVGPTPANIAAMGTKVEAKQLAEAAGVPVLPSAVAIGDDPAVWLESAERVGFPVLVKASSGGGGRGMRIVPSPQDLADAIVGARREAAASFGDATVFLERYLPAPRHIEFQIFGDTHGTVIHLGERECSIQRRHQKIVEEAPSPVLTDEMRTVMGAASVSLASSIGYVGAGTVEFLYDDANGSPEYFFLEMNTRLQVEHPVTECVTGTDLVRWQIDIANGLPLPLAQNEVDRQGHAIEVRLYAEDPANDFLPTFGDLYTYETPIDGFGLRFENGVESGTSVTTFFDPMLAKVVAHAPDRVAASRKLAGALRSMRIHGPVTNREFLVGVLDDSDFLAGATTTAFVERYVHRRSAFLPDGQEDLHLIAALVSGSLRRAAADARWSFAAIGWRNMGSHRQLIDFLDHAGQVRRCTYRWMNGQLVVVTINGEEFAAQLVRVTELAAGHELVLEISGVTLTIGTTHIGETTWCNSSLGQSAWKTVERFSVPTSGATTGRPVSPVPGRIVALHVAEGDSVSAGDVLVTLEAMKMEHRILAPTDGVIGEVLCRVGDQVDAQQLLVVLQ